MTSQLGVLHNPLEVRMKGLVLSRGLREGCLAEAVTCYLGLD
jgi:hypothetical protein